MRSAHALCLHVAALSAALLGAAVLAGPACSLISSGDDCKSACQVFVTCGTLKTSDCGLYCTGEVYSAQLAGCSDQFEALNACGKTNTACNASTCASEQDAFTKCVMSYCANNPMGDGCPGASDGGTDGGGTGGGATSSDGG